MPSGHPPDHPRSIPKFSIFFKIFDFFKNTFFIGKIKKYKKNYGNYGSKMGHFDVYLRLSELILRWFFHFQMRGVRLRVRCFEFFEFWFIFCKNIQKYGRKKAYNWIFYPSSRLNHCLPLIRTVLLCRIMSSILENLKKNYLLTVTPGPFF